MGPRPRRTQAERTASTQQKLVKGAIALLKQKRYAGFRVAEVAKVAGVSRGAQTHHFPVKDALVLQALEKVYIDSHRKALERIEKARAEPGRLLQAMIEDSQDFFLGEDFYVALDLMMVGGDQPLGQEAKRLSREYRVSVEKAWIEAFTEAGYPPLQAEDCIHLTFAMTRGLSVRKLMSGEVAHFPRLFSRWEAIAEEMLQPAAKKRPAKPLAT